MKKSSLQLLAILSFIILSVLLCSSPSFASGTSSTSQAERSAELGHEAKGRIEQSTQYNIDIGNRIDESQNAIHEARSYLVRNVELIDRIERANRERQENNQTTTDATQPISDGGSGSSNRSSDSSIER